MLLLLLKIILFAVVAVGLAEIAARIYFRRRYGIPFQSRMIGEYPYRSFIEKVAPPLYYRFRRGFRSTTVNINRFGCRGPEPAPDGEKKRVLVIGESNFFGVKLRRESEVWDARMRALFRLRGIDDWEVINAGSPIYNSTQHLKYWEQEITAVKPDIVVFGFGLNDLSQAWMMGKKWDPETTVWPEKFIYALERHTPRWQHFLANFCLWLLWKRRTSERREFPRMDDNFQWEKCLEVIAENLRALRDLARAQGAQVAGSVVGFIFDREPTPEDCRRLDAIQSNWRSFQSGRGAYDLALLDEFYRIFRELEIPCIDFDKTLRRHPRRYELYLDVAHFNPAGMRVLARILFDEIEKLGWWRLDEAKSGKQDEE